MKRKEKNNGILRYVAISLITALIVVGGGNVLAYVSNSVEAPNLIAEGDINIETYYEAEKRVDLEEVNLGGFPGPDIYSELNIYGNVTSGLISLATSTAGTGQVFTEAQLRDNKILDIVLNVQSATYTMPATSTMISLLPDIGMTREWFIHNATSTSGIVLTIVTGAGMDLVGVDANADTLAPLSWARLVCFQTAYLTENNQNIACIIDEEIPVD